MPTISHIAKKIVEERPFLQHALSAGIVNYAALAEEYLPEIEKELGKKATQSAAVMAFRRHAEKIRERESKTPSFNYDSEITMKTHLVDIVVRKSTAFFGKLEAIYGLINYEKGDFLNIIHGNTETVIIVNVRHKEEILKVLKDEEIVTVEDNAVSLSLRFNPEFYDTPGVISNVVRRFAWENINILELITTSTEMTFILHKDDVMRAYNLLHSLIENDN